MNRLPRVDCFDGLGFDGIFGFFLGGCVWLVFVLGVGLGYGWSNLGI